MAQIKLQMEGIRIRYDREWILRDFSLALEAGEFVSVVGPSGCGKSTLLHLTAGLLPLEQGRILVDGGEIHGISPHFSLMPQDDLLLPWMTVLDNVCLYGKIHGSLPEVKRRAMENMDSFGLGGYEASYPGQLSGGMRQRAAFLRTALCPADILLLDEPFASLDVITREEMQDWLLRMRQQLGRTVLLVTHDIDEAIYLSDRVIALGGRPAEIRAEVAIREDARSRPWLFRQAELKNRIYSCLKGDAEDAL